ncbi:MAG: hypothetical protein ACK5PP_06235 [Acidimicrobiales bacterium]
MTTARWAVSAAGLLGGCLLLSGCGTAGGTDAAAPDAYTVTNLVVHGQTVEPVTALIEIDRTYGDLVIDTDCGTALGAVALHDDGRAAVSLPGGSDRPCDPATRTGVDTLIAALERTATWSESASAIVFSNADRDVITIRG